MRRSEAGFPGRFTPSRPKWALFSLGVLSRSSRMWHVNLTFTFAFTTTTACTDPNASPMPSTNSHIQLRAHETAHIAHELSFNQPAEDPHSHAPYISATVRAGHTNTPASSRRPSSPLAYLSTSSCIVSRMHVPGRARRTATNGSLAFVVHTTTVVVHTTCCKDVGEPAIATARDDAIRQVTWPSPADIDIPQARPAVGACVTNSEVYRAEGRRSDVCPLTFPKSEPGRYSLIRSEHPRQSSGRYRRVTACPEYLRRAPSHSCVTHIARIVTVLSARPQLQESLQLSNLRI